MMPRAMVRLSAGREEMSDELQALCFLAGANSIFYGEKLLTTGNPDTAHDRALFERLDIVPMPMPLGSDPFSAPPVSRAELPQKGSDPVLSAEPDTVHCAIAG